MVNQYSWCWIPNDTVLQHSIYILLTVKVVPGEHVKQVWKKRLQQKPFFHWPNSQSPAVFQKIHCISTRKRKKLKKVTAKKTTKKMKNGSAWIVMSPGMSMVKIAGLCDICSRKYHLQCSGRQYIRLRCLLCLWWMFMRLHDKKATLSYWKTDFGFFETICFGLFTRTHWQVIYYKWCTIMMYYISKFITERILEPSQTFKIRWCFSQNQLLALNC